MTETTATILVGPMEQHCSGPRFQARHLLILREGFRATWQVIPVDPREARRALHQRRDHRGGAWATARPDAPHHLLAHGLLAFLAEIEPSMVLTHEHLAGLITASEGGHLETTVPDTEAATEIAAALPRPIGVWITLDPTASIRADEADQLVGPEVHVAITTAIWHEPADAAGQAAAGSGR
jgi:hypothetical protein